MFPRLGILNSAQQDFIRWSARQLSSSLVEKHLLVIQALARELQRKRSLDRDQIFAAVRSAPGGYEVLGEGPPPPLVRHFTDQRSPPSDDVAVISRESGVIGIVRRTTDGYVG